MDNTFLAADPMGLGTKWNGSPGSLFLTDEWGDVKVIQMHSKFRDITKRLHTFYVSTQIGVGGQAVSVWTNVNYTGLYLWNPVGSPVTVSLISVSTALAVAEAAISAIGIGKLTSTGTVNHPYTPLPCYLSNTTAAPYCAAGYDLTLGATTQMTWQWGLVGGSLINLMPYASGPTVTDGAFEYGPGSGCCIMAMSAVTGWFSFVFEEIII